MKLDAKIKELNKKARDKFYRRGEQKKTGKSGSEIYTIDTWGHTRKGDWYGPQFLFNTAFHLVVGLLVTLFQLSNILGVGAIAAYREYKQPQGTWYKKTWDVFCFCFPWLVLISILLGVLL